MLNCIQHAVRLIMIFERHVSSSAARQAFAFGSNTAFEIGAQRAAGLFVACHVPMVCCILILQRRPIARLTFACQCCFLAVGDQVHKTFTWRTRSHLITVGCTMVTVLLICPFSTRSACLRPDRSVLGNVLPLPAHGLLYARLLAMMLIVDRLIRVFWTSGASACSDLAVRCDVFRWTTLWLRRAFHVPVTFLIFKGVWFTG